MRDAAYLALAGYLEEKLQASANVPYRVELVTASSYAGVLTDFQEGRIDSAFCGSLVAVVAIDRYQAKVILKSETADVNLSTYSDTTGGITAASRLPSGRCASSKGLSSSSFLPSCGRPRGPALGEPA